MINTLAIGLLLWLGAGFATLSYLCNRRELEPNGPLQTLSIILFWPIYLLFTP